MAALVGSAPYAKSGAKHVIRNLPAVCLRTLEESHAQRVVVALEEAGATVKLVRD